MEIRPGLVGLFRYSPAESKWEWDEVACRLHGLRPRQGLLDTDGLLRFVLPEDQASLLSALSACDERLLLRYRVALSNSDVRHLLVVGHAVVDSEGARHAQGHIVDVTGELRVAVEEASQAAVRAAVEGRGVIDQAKGTIMLAYGLTDDQAFGLLRWWSRNRNIRLRLLAERLMAQAVSGAHSSDDLRAAFDRAMHDQTAAPDQR